MRNIVTFGHSGLGCLLGACLGLLCLASSATAQDDARTRQLKLLCVQLSGDLTEPGGLAAFKRCLATHDPLGEIKRHAINNGRTSQPADRPEIEPPAGFGRTTRRIEAEGVNLFRIVNGHDAYAIDRDGTLWHWSLGVKQSVHAMDHRIADIFAGAGDEALVLGIDGTLWHEAGDGQNRTVVDHTVAAAQAVGAVGDTTIYVLGADGRLWREAGDATHRGLVDSEVKAFQAVDASVVLVLGRDGKLWRETGDMKTRSLIAGNIAQFQYVADGNTTFVLTPANELWRQKDTDPPQQIDHDVQAFQAIGKGPVYVLAKDGRVWLEAGNRDRAQLVDRQALAGLGRRAFEVLDAGHSLILGEDHKLWAETMPVQP